VLEIIFVMADGDHIREKVEGLLFDGKLEELAIFSKALVAAIDAIRGFAISAMSADIVVSAGDDLMAKIERRRYNATLLLGMTKLFEGICGCALSVGVGSSIEDAYLALRRAKSRSGPQIVEGASRE